MMTRRDFLKVSALTAAHVGLLSTGLASVARAAGKEDIAFLPALEQIRRFKAGTLSPVDVLNAQIERIKLYNGPLNVNGRELPNYLEFNGKVNAITFEHFKEALKAAKDSEMRYKAGTARSLEGLTIAIKDEHAVNGWRVTMGSVYYQDKILCEDNSPIIEKLLEAGAVLHIQTTVPEYYIHFQTWSKLWGVTRNPWNLAYAVGGSSGGSGAALAAGFTSLATGSDMGGSIRMPASLCGVYGFKAPFGRIATSDISYETGGPMARTFGDMALMQNIIAGPHPTVHASLRSKLEYPLSYASVQGVKVAVDYCNTWHPAGLDPAVENSLRDAVEVLRKQGAIVEEVKLGITGKEVFHTFAEGLRSTGICEMMPTDPASLEQMTSYASNFLKTTPNAGPAAMVAADALAAKMHNLVQKEVFSKGNTTLIMPTLATPYITAENRGVTDTVLINGKVVDSGMEQCLTYLWNLLSRYPVVDVPVGLAPNNVPMGMQVVGNTFDDLAAFRVASAYSTAGLNLYNGNNLPDYRNQVQTRA